MDSPRRLHHLERPGIPVDWLLAVREVGLEEANRIEDHRLLMEHMLGRPVSFEDAVDDDKRRLI